MAENDVLVPTCELQDFSIGGTLLQNGVDVSGSVAVVTQSFRDVRLVFSSTGIQPIRLLVALRPEFGQRRMTCLLRLPLLVAPPGLSGGHLIRTSVVILECAVHRGYVEVELVGDLLGRRPGFLDESLNPTYGNPPALDGGSSWRFVAIGTAD